MSDYNHAQAARRHFFDATILAGQQRIANADQLYGYAGECALIALLVYLRDGAALFGADGNIEESYRKHPQFLWKKFRFFAEGHRGRVLLARLGFSQNPFETWHTDHRYYSDSAAVGSAVIERHRSAAQRCVEVLEQYEREASALQGKAEEKKE